MKLDYEKLEEFMDSSLTIAPPSIQDILNKETNSMFGGLGSFLGYFKGIAVKDRYTTNYGFSIITSELVTAIAEYVGENEVMELGSGSGYLARALESAGVRIYTVDTDDWGFQTIYRKTDLVSSFRELDPSGYNTFIMSWPNYGEPAAYEIISKMKSGDRLIYCGEGRGGCTACDNFYDLLNKEWSLEPILLPSITFNNIRDWWRVYVKN